MLKAAVNVRLPLADGDFRLHLYQDPKDDKEHLVLIHGDIRQGDSVLMRVHSECLTGDIFGSQRCDCGSQLQNALDQIVAEGRGILIYLRQEGRGIGLLDKLRAYELQDAGHDTVEANLLLGHQADERKYDIVPEILKSLGISSVRVITNNPEKLEALTSAKIRTERVRSPLVVNKENQAYLKVKAIKLHHFYNPDEVCMVE